MVGRYGGEEFLVVLPGCDQASALKIAERIRERIAGEPVVHGGAPVDISASLGVTVCCNDPGHASVTGLLSTADDALYRAKRTGRNRVEFNAMP